MKIIAVVVTYNRLELLKRSMDSCGRTNRLSDIIVVNNGSTDGTKEWLDKQDDLTVIHQSNVGVRVVSIRASKRLMPKMPTGSGVWTTMSFPEPTAWKTYCPTPAIKRWESWLPDDYWKEKSFTNDFCSYNLTQPFRSMYQDKLAKREVTAPVEIVGTAFEGLFGPERGSCSHWPSQQRVVHFL